MRIREQHESTLRIITYSSLVLLGIAIVVITTLLVLSDNNVDQCHIPDPPRDILFTPYDYNALKISWTTSSKNRECNIAYNLMFDYKGNEWNFRTSNEFVILENMYTCSILMVRIWSTTRWGDTSKYAINHFFVKPTTISDVQNLTIRPSSEGMIIVTWDGPPNISECNLVYTVTITNPDDYNDQDSCENLLSRSCILKEYCNISTNTIDINILTRIPGTEIQANTSISHECFRNPTSGK